MEASQELQEESGVDTTIRRPLASAEGDNEITSRRSQTREVSSRYKSPTPSNNSRRSPSPILTRTINPTSQMGSSKRPLSVERKRPSSKPTSPSSRPTSPSARPSTPISHTSSAEQHLSSSKRIGSSSSSSSKLPEVLWPSTMRSLSVSFQPNSASVPVCMKEKEKPLTHALSDRTLKHSSNITTVSTRKLTPERKRSPLKGEVHNNQLENSRPVDEVQTRLIDQHRWPSRAGGGKLSSLALSRSVDLSSDSFGKSPTGSSSSSPLSNSDMELGRLYGEGSSDNVGIFSSSSPPSNTEVALRKLSSEGLSDNVGKFSSSSSLSTTVPPRRLSAEGVSGVVRFPSSSSLSTTGIPLRRLSTEGVSDNVRRFSSSSSLSSTGIPSRRLSVEGVPTVGRFSSSSSLSTTGIPSRLFPEDVSDNVGKFSSISSLPSTGIPSSRLTGKSVLDDVERFPSSSSLSSTVIPLSEGVSDKSERFSNSSSLSSTGIPTSEGVSNNFERYLSSSSISSSGIPPRESVSDDVGSLSSSLPLSSTGVPSRRLSAESVSDDVARFLNSSSLSSTEVPSSERVSDNVERFSSSSLLSSTRIPSMRVSAEGVFDNVDKFLSSSSLSSTGIPSTVAVSDNVEIFSSSSPLSSNRIPSTRVCAEGVLDIAERSSSSSSPSSTGIPSRRLSIACVSDSARKFTSSSSLSSSGIPLRGRSAESISRNVQKISEDSSGKQSVFDEDHSAGGLRLKSVDDIFISEPKEDSLSSSRRASLGALPARSRLVPGQRPSSPNRTPVSKGAPNLLRTRPSAEGVSVNVGKFSSSASLSSSGIPLRRLYAEGIPRNLQKSSSDSSGKHSEIDEDHRARAMRLKSTDDIFFREPKENKLSSSRRASLGTLSARSKLVPGQRLPSPNRTPVSKGPPSPLRTRLSAENVSDNLERFSSSSSLSSIGISPKKLSAEGIQRNLQKSSSDSSGKQSKFDEDCMDGGLRLKSVDDIFLRDPKEDTLSSSRRASLGTLLARPRLVPGQRPLSPNRTPVSKGSLSPFRRLSAEDVSDNLERLSSSSSLSNTKLPSEGVSAEGVSDNVQRFLSSSLSSTGIASSRLSSDGLSDSTGKFASSSPLSSCEIPSRTLSAESVSGNLQKSCGDSLAKQLVFDKDRKACGLHLESADAIFLLEPKEDTVSSSRRASLGALPARSRLASGKRLSSPNRTLVSKGTPSPLRARLSAKSVSDNVERFLSSSSLSSTGIPSRRLSTDSVSDNFGKLLSSSSLSSTGILSRRLSAEGIPRNLQKSSGDSSGKQPVFIDDDRAGGLHLKSADDIFLSELKEETLSSSRRASLGALPAISRLGPVQRLPSPVRTMVSKGAPSPVRTRPSTPTQARGTSASMVRPSSPRVRPSSPRVRPSSPSVRPSSPRVRPSSPTKHSASTTSVFSFLPDIMNCKKTSQLEDAHQMRLLHNRYLQWRFTNAQADATMFFQRIHAEESVYNVWQTNLHLWDSVITKRIEVQSLKLELKENLVLREQLSYLEDWALHETEYSASLVGAIRDFEATTLRLPITGGAKADIGSLKAAIGSAINVMHTTVSSIYSALPKVEDMNSVISELAELAGQEMDSLEECDDLLASAATMQVREYSLRTQQIQSKQDLRSTRNSTLWETTT